MPNNETKQTRGSETAKKWALTRGEDFGRAVRKYRRHAGWSAVQLAAVTESLGYPITRGTIAKIEGNHRAGKIDMAEVVVLAESLAVPPAALLIPDYPKGFVEILPGQHASSEGAWEWLTGYNIVTSADDGAIIFHDEHILRELVEAVRERDRINEPLLELTNAIAPEKLTPEQNRKMDELLARLDHLSKKIAELTITDDDG